jgi:hypothetical protein
LDTDRDTKKKGPDRLNCYIQFRRRPEFERISAPYDTRVVTTSDHQPLDVPESCSQTLLGDADPFEDGFGFGHLVRLIGERPIAGK